MSSPTFLSPRMYVFRRDYSRNGLFSTFSWSSVVALWGASSTVLQNAVCGNRLTCMLIRRAVGRTLVPDCWIFVVILSALRQSELARASTRVFTWPCVPSECRPPTPTSISCSYSSAVASISALASVMLAGLHPGLVSLSKVKWAGFSTGGLLPRIGFGFTTRRSRSLAKYASVCARLHRY
jgi:hypothetical protein